MFETDKVPLHLSMDFHGAFVCSRGFSIDKCGGIFNRLPIHIQEIFDSYSMMCQLFCTFFALISDEFTIDGQYMSTTCSIEFG